MTTKYKQTIKVSTNIGGECFTNELTISVEADSYEEARDKIFKICKNAWVGTDASCPILFDNN